MKLIRVLLILIIIGTTLSIIPSMENRETSQRSIGIGTTMPHPFPGGDGIVVMCRSWFIFEAWAEDKPVPKIPPAPTSYDLPRDQVQEYRAIEAEERAMRAEATLALQSLEKRRTEILDGWKAQAGGSLEGWQLDLAKGQLKKTEPEKNKGK